MSNTLSSQSRKNSDLKHTHTHTGKGASFFSLGWEGDECWDYFWEVEFEISVGNEERNVQSNMAHTEGIMSQYHINGYWIYDCMRSLKESDG